MFCPACSAYLTEKDLQKTGVKYAPGNVPIEYDARCPNCGVEMGKVSWGQLTVNPELAKKISAAAPNSEEHETSPVMHEESVAKAKSCPHCGKTLPEDF